MLLCVTLADFWVCLNTPAISRMDGIDTHLSEEESEVNEWRVGRHRPLQHVLITMATDRFADEL